MSERDVATFGAAVRAKRLQRDLGLREFAAKVGMSPTYLSKVERGEFNPPAEDKIVAIARALGEDTDELLALAGRVASDLDQIIRTSPREMAALVRVAEGLSPANIRRLTEHATHLRRR
ncbi:MAG: helix-turn-helix transcriptional regulator [Anaerolineae bacterium]